MSTTPRRAWAGLAALLLPVFLVSMDVSVLYLAIPSITDALAPSAAQQLWILDIYGFLIAGLLITMGNVGDRVGRRRVLLAGAAVFAQYNYDDRKTVAASAPSSVARSVRWTDSRVSLPPALAMIVVP